MKFKHIIWDWNGTLFDDAHICRQITSAHMARLSIPQISEELHQRNFTHPVREYYERIGFDWSSCTFEEIAQSFIIEYEARMHEAHMRQEMLELIPELSAKGVTHAVLSAVRHDLLRALR